MNGDVNAVGAYVSALKDHPALAGWYIYDEPDEIGISVSEGEAVYQRIKSLSDKPIYGATDADRRAFSSPPQQAYVDSHDRLVTFEYPFDVGDGEFVGMQPSGFLNSNRGWLQSTARSASQARAAGKPWYNAIQAYGRDAQFPALGTDLRLPTADELRFMTFYSIVNHHADGVFFWAGQFTDGSDAIAGQPYPQDGLTWRSEVFKALTGEFNEHYGRALAAGPMQDVVSVSGGGAVVAELYRDPADGRMYLLVTNASGSAAQARLTFSDAANYGGMTTLAGAALPWSDGVVDLSLSAYGTGVYRVLPAVIPAPGGMAVAALALLPMRRRSRR